MSDEEPDFSKCSCDSPGFCPLYNKVMGEKPPNWMYCQGLSPQEREEYYNSSKRHIRTLMPSGKGSVSIIDFYDELPPKTSDLAVVTVPANGYALDHIAISRDKIKSYAKKCGADYIELLGNQSPDWPMSNKYRIHQVTKVYEKTLYIDCDVLINDGVPNIFEITPDDKISGFDELHLFTMPLGGGENEGIRWVKHEQDMIRAKLNMGDVDVLQRMINGGVLVIPKSMADYYKQPDETYPKLWCFDQQYLSLSLDSDNFFPLEDKWNWEFIRQDFWEGAKDAYFIHVNYARPNKYRTRLMERFLMGNYTKISSQMTENPLVIKWSHPNSKGYFVEYVPVNDDPPKEDVDKNLIITVAIGEEYGELIKLTGPHLENYAKRCNADYIVVGGEKTQGYPWLEKLRIYPFIQKYNRTAFVDADIFISKDAPNIFDEVPEDCVGAFCDWEQNSKPAKIHGNYWIDRWKSERLDVATSILNPKDFKKYIDLSHDKTLINSGVVICSKQHADVWEPINKPFVKHTLSEQYIVEMRILLRHKWHQLDKVWNCQPWFSDGVFYTEPSYFKHLAGWSNTKYMISDEGYMYENMTRQDLMKRIIEDDKK
jgi:lipopolysaccharide biosynthesis glycosyltransferase